MIRPQSSASTNDPDVWFVVPAYQASRTIVRSVRSALRQTGIRANVLVVDHGSTDGTLERLRELRSADLHLEALTRTADEVRSPSRPLNIGITFVLARSVVPRQQAWLFRLDADDVLAADHVVARQLARGERRRLVMATLVFADPDLRKAYDYGPRRSHRTLAGLPGRDTYAVAHHANAVRLDLLEECLRDGDVYDPRLETGEDLGATCRLLRSLHGRESDFAFVDTPYCIKEFSTGTITGSLSLNRAWAAHRSLYRDNPELSRFAIVRGFAELALSRVTSEPFARRVLQHIAGRNGHYRDVPWWVVENRLNELADHGPPTPAPIKSQSSLATQEGE